MRLLSRDHVVAIAHRGGSALRPENTVLAFDHAAALGVDGLECDARVTRDGEVVVMHDPTLERTTDGRGAVADLTLADIERLDAAAGFGPDRGWPYRGQGVGVPTLRSLLQRHADFPFVVEIKGDRIEAADCVLAVIREVDAQDRVIVAGFDHGVVSHVRRVAPHIATSASRSEILEARAWSSLGMKPRMTGYRVFQAPFRFRGRQALRPGFVRAARRAGVPVHSWIIDQPDNLRTVVAWGVTGLISDRPDAALEVARDANRAR